MTIVLPHSQTVPLMHCNDCLTLDESYSRNHYVVDAKPGDEATLTAYAYKSLLLSSKPF